MRFVRSLRRYVALLRQAPLRSPSLAQTAPSSVQRQPHECLEGDLLLLILLLHLGKSSVFLLHRFKHFFFDFIFARIGTLHITSLLFCDIVLFAPLIVVLLLSLLLLARRCAVVICEQAVAFVPIVERFARMPEYARRLQRSAVVVSLRFLQLCFRVRPFVFNVACSWTRSIYSLLSRSISASAFGP